ncbi:hypothetical protein P43SY_003535 [Pythium insidiosum]|uniref:WW domain-containing protein n=1 Tax=Pythium insidiosum TaxID=114742 RepID=A0AAD5LIB9_PYTIN|nr:hypothetical protein P43SY_003535 [Pythium insidiosum]
MAVREWEKHIDDATQTAYYYNTRTGESSWEAPDGFDDAPATSERAPARWRRIVDESSGKPYFYDEANDVTQWEEPADAVIIESDEDEERADSERDDQEAADEHEQSEQEEEASGAKAPSATASNDDDGDDDDDKKNDVDAEKPNRHEWVRYVDATSGKPYFHDAVTGKTQWEQPDHFVEANARPARPAVSAEYLEHLHRTRAQRMARVSQQAVDPEGHLSRLNALLDKIPAAPSAAPSSSPSEANESEAPTQTASRPEWEQHVDPHSQRYYYHNVVTGTTQWQRPDGPIVSALADWIPPESPADDADAEPRHQPTVSGANYVATAKFNRLTGRYEQLGGDEYWQSMGVATDREGRQMGHFFDLKQLEKNRADAKRIKEQLKRKNVDWKKVAAEKKARKQKRQNEWLFQD